MVELTWPQVRQKLLTRLARLDPTIAPRLDDAEQRFSTVFENFVTQSDDLVEEVHASYDPASADVTEDFLIPEQAESSIPEYLR